MGGEIPPLDSRSFHPTQHNPTQWCNLKIPKQIVIPKRDFVADRAGFGMTRGGLFLRKLRHHTTPKSNGRPDSCESPDARAALLELLTHKTRTWRDSREWHLCARVSPRTCLRVALRCTRAITFRGCPVQAPRLGRGFSCSKSSRASLGGCPKERSANGAATNEPCILGRQGRDPDCPEQHRTE